MALWPGANRLSTPHGGGRLVRPTSCIRAIHARPSGLCALFPKLAHLAAPFTQHCFTSSAGYSWPSQLRLEDGCDRYHATIAGRLSVAAHQAAISRAFFRLRTGPGEECQCI